ncbi:hypothetical protein HII28_02285 [Planctomonas sp. JC2975]|nr:hypothetical protein [Planctomonas sp. JC2975]NNC10716.1 hypothetical protein [Planctomonas sp. JC2975]
MRERPTFDSEQPDDALLTPEEQARVDEGMRRLAAERAIEDEIPDINDQR